MRRSGPNESVVPPTCQQIEPAPDHGRRHALGTRRRGQAAARRDRDEGFHGLELVHIDFFHVLLARGPFAVAQALDAAHDLDDALQQQQATGDRDHALERVDGQRRGTEGRFADRQRVVTRDGVRLPMTAREFDLLLFLASHPGQVF